MKYDLDMKYQKARLYIECEADVDFEEGTEIKNVRVWVYEGQSSKMKEVTGKYLEFMLDDEFFDNLRDEIEEIERNKEVPSQSDIEADIGCEKYHAKVNEGR